MKTLTELNLESPIRANGIEVKTLALRRPIVADSIAAESFQGTDTQKELQLFANLCEVPPEDLQKLDLKDFRRLQEVVSSFLS